MKSRPWPLILLALFQIISPAGTLLFNAWALDVKPAYVWAWILQKPALQVFEILAIRPIAGLAIYRMKSWSYIVFFAALSWSLIANLSRMNFARQHFSVGLIVSAYLVQIGLGLYFALPSVRRTYLDPRVRWWEAKRRYLLEIPVSLGAYSAQMKNISEGGVFVESMAPLTTGQELPVQFEILGVVYQAQGKVMYVSGAQAPASGIMFVHTPESHRIFRRLSKGLEVLGVPHRDQQNQEPWHLSILKWFKNLIKTGRGLTPDLGPQKRN